MKLTTQHPILTVCVGIPISLAALYFSWVSFAIALSFLPKIFHGDLLGLLWSLPGVLGLWAIFTGMRNLLRFETAHLGLRWHDWIGGIFGFIANLAIITLVISAIFKDPQRILFDDDTFWLLPVALPVAGAPICCFCIVAYRFLQHRRQLP